MNTGSKYGPLAHLVEHLICNEGVAGSSPVRSTKQVVERRLFTWAVSKQTALLVSGREKLFINNYGFIQNYLKRYTGHVMTEIPVKFL